jgi:hypothetical protein
MNCKCKVDQRRLTPGVFNLKQFLNGSETMIWELDNCVINGGTCDLKNYDAFLTLCVAGEIDEILLTKRQTGDTLQLIWDVGAYATALTGYVKYQISFRSANFDTLGVIADDPEANGLYTLVDVNTFNTARVFKKAENGYHVKWDAGNGRWALYQADGVSVIDFQTTPNTEPYCGVWGNIAVGNNEAAAWISDEAIMYVSDSIAADQKVTGNFPTILRQLWARLSKFGVASINGKSGVVDLSPVDIGAADAKHGHSILDVENLKNTLDDKATQSDLSKYLPLSGGTMTGDLQIGSVINKPNLTSALRLLGGTTSSNGAYIEVGGKDYQGTDKGGNIALVAKNRSGSNTLKISPDGALTLNGKNIASSVNGVTADASGNVTISAGNVGAVPTSGGTMTGTLFLDVSDYLFRTVDNSHICINGSSRYGNGAALVLLGKDVKSDYDSPGIFKLWANNGIADSWLIGMPGGPLFWRNQILVSTVDGIGADSTGNVVLDAMPKRGGTVTGNLEVNGNLTMGLKKVLTEESGAIVTESWRASDGSSWYRKYSDGWIEQGGTCNISESGFYTVTLLTSFATTEYIALKNYPCGGNTPAWDREVSMFNQTTTSMETYNDIGDATWFKWYACGY